eukprot:CAMPEP_0175938200 /NCGR_PEP_ID=MMETSP0108-20121206/22565_1 /TAXON_ID=195067 ORGANISM="Goniomonas pacifica, Strain CCMP1869" /NCGR_SAMPLE_ID=MMETSP0108 /ASSEMBLY_ACC=CAM_ASM_000204 /LENGTH=187 /DNA_ID=CAMNT_0017262427 /DNA_START=272 /DNA_END=832 /DNA_ORIENTATION=+
MHGTRGGGGVTTGHLTEHDFRYRTVVIVLSLSLFLSLLCLLRQYTPLSLVVTSRCSTAPTQSTNFSGSRELDVLLARCRAAVTSAARGSVTDAKGTPVNLDNESANDVITELLRACKAVNDQEAEHQEHSFRDAAAGEFAHETLAQACPLRQIPPDYHERVQAHALNNGSGSNRYVCHNNGALPPPL